ncbi:hypothetical protein [Streptomyces sp. NPDC053427]
MIARNPHLKASAKVAGAHGSILRNDFRAVADADADAVRETSAAHDLEVR